MRLICATAKNEIRLSHKAMCKQRHRSVRTFRPFNTFIAPCVSLSLIHTLKDRIAPNVDCNSTCTLEYKIIGIC